MPMCYNVGKLDACQNGLTVQVSATRESTDPSWNRGKVIFTDEHSTMDVGMFYTSMSPRDARELAKELTHYAKIVEKEYNENPYWIVLLNNEPAYYDGDMMWYQTEQEVKDAVKKLTKLSEERYQDACRFFKSEGWKPSPKCKTDPVIHWGYRKLTADEFYDYTE